MKRILKIGMDVHTTNYTLCAMEPIIGEDDREDCNIFHSQSTVKTLESASQLPYRHI